MSVPNPVSTSGVMGWLAYLTYLVGVAWVLKDQVKATMVTARSQPVGCELLWANLDVYADGLEDVFFSV